jgi:hypothetical protein
MKYSKLKAKLKNKSFVLRKLRESAEDEKELSKFHRFECSDFFRGETLAKLNYEVYLETGKKIWRRTKILERIYRSLK